MRESIDGASFAQAMIHAAASLNLQKQQINELNVFPVPDGDTGTNMSLTIGTAAAELARSRRRRPWAQAASDQRLRPAAGRPRQLRRHSVPAVPRHLPRRSRTRRPCDGGDFAAALDEGVAAAYKAVMKPAEGTILTVSRLAAERAAEASPEDTIASSSCWRRPSSEGADGAGRHRQP